MQSVTVKWGKERYNVALDTAQSGAAFKAAVAKATGM